MSAAGPGAATPPLVLRSSDAIADADRAPGALVGGKARALAEAGRAGLPVPPWFVVTAEAFIDGLTGEQRALTEAIDVAAAAAKGAQTTSAAEGTAASLDALRLLVAEAPLSARFGAALADAIAQLSPAGEPLAVRSSASDEDGAAHSFAGQLESYLFVPPADVDARVRDVWQSGLSDRLVEYRRHHRLSLPPRLPAVLVQRMVRPRAAGVAFAADPVSGRRGVAIVSAVPGVGTGLVSGEADADTWHVDRTGTIVARTIADTRTTHDAGGGGRPIAVSDADARAPALTDAQVLAVVALARDASRHAGRPQDIEWAIEGERLFLLQTRPITTLTARADPDALLAIWDNSNIVESYSGVTTPLTFSFAAEVYQGVYRQFCRLMGVPARVLAEEDDTFRNMLGLIRGRLYYNLLNWYRVLALLPGFTVNRRFMEQMMGVRESLPPSITETIAASAAAARGANGRARGTLRDALALGGTIAGLIVNYVRLPRQIARFTARLDAALHEAPETAYDGASEGGTRDSASDDGASDGAARDGGARDSVPGGAHGVARDGAAGEARDASRNRGVDGARRATPAMPLADQRPDELAGAYRDLQRKLLTRWDAPLVNDFFAMIFYGVLRQLSARWCGDTEGTLQNDLVGGEGGMVSAEPAQRLQAMARVAAAHPDLAGALRTGSLDAARRAIAAVPDLAALHDAYLRKFGERCVNELKLESATLHDDPLPLLRAVGHLALHAPAAAEGQAQALRAQARERARAALARHPLRRLIFSWVLRNARARVRDRENLRLERTRLFGRVRRIVVELGRRLHALDRLDDPRDVFYLEIDELLAFVEGRATCTDLRSLARLRRAEFATYAADAPPDDRFETHGLPYQGHTFTRDAASLGRTTGTGADGPATTGTDASASADADARQGLGCCPGVVRGPVRVVRDPHAIALDRRGILVAEHTDPGWIMIFPSATGLLVERGSLLSHAAIVARELGIPAIVSVPGVTHWLRDGDWVEMDGATGRVRRIAADAPPDGAPGGTPDAAPGVTPGVAPGGGQDTASGVASGATSAAISEAAGDRAADTHAQ